MVKKGVQPSGTQKRRSTSSGGLLDSVTESDGVGIGSIEARKPVALLRLFQKDESSVIVSWVLLD